MNRIDLRVLEQLSVIFVPLRDTEGLADGVELLPGALADCVHLRVGMALIDGNELGAEAEADNGNFYLLLIGHGKQGRGKDGRSVGGKRAP